MPANSLDLIESGNTTWSWKPTTGGVTGSAKFRTPRVNPYAALQTLDQLVDDKSLPVAEFAAADGTRQLFPEQSTEVLAGMLRRDKALNDGQTVWFLLMALSGVMCVFFFTYVRQIDPMEGVMYGGATAVGGALAFIRFYAGNARKKSDRYFAIGMDWLLFTTTLALGIRFFVEASQGLTWKGRTRLKPTWIEFWSVVMSLPFLLYPLYFSLRSLRALFGAQLLFGPERLHAESLKTELDYRGLHGIE